MSDSSLKGRVVKGIFWTSLEQLSGQIVNFALGVVLARLLTPDDYGTVALVNIFIVIASVLVTSGLGQALVQKKDADDLDFSSVFYLSLLIATLLVAGLFAAAPAIARIYRIEELVPIIRVLSVNLLFFACNSVLNADLYRKMRFDLTFRISLIAALVAAGVGILLAVCGYGVWSLVWSSVASSLAGVLARCYYVRWTPSLAFSLKRVGPLWRYGWRILLKQLLGSLMTNLYGFLTGKFYSRADLAYMNKGRNIPELVANNISSSLLESSFPALVRLQDDEGRMREAIRRLLVVSSFLVFPLMVFLAAVSAPFISFLYGERWVNCVPFMQLTCLSLAIFPLNGICNLGVLAKGRSDISLRIDIGSTVLSLVVLATCLPRGVLFWFATVTFVSMAYTCLVYCPVCLRVLRYPLVQLLRDICLPVLTATVVGVAMLALSHFLPTGSVWKNMGCLSVQFVVAVSLVAAIAWVFRARAAREILMVVRDKVPVHGAWWTYVSRHFKLEG